MKDATIEELYIERLTNALDKAIDERNVARDEVARLRDGRQGLNAGGRIGQLGRGATDDIDGARYIVVHSNDQRVPEHARQDNFHIIDQVTGEWTGWCDGGEPEDQLLVRDWRWVVDALNKLASERDEARRLLAEADGAVATLMDCADLTTEERDTVASLLARHIEESRTPATTLTLHDYQTGEAIRELTAEESAAYLVQIGSDDVGAVRGDDYGYPGRSVYAV